MKKYEAIFIIKPDNEERIKDVIDRINNIVLSEYCEITHKENVGIKKLAYEIKSYKTGYYYYINFNMNINVLGRISLKFNTIEEIIKYIFLEL